jgi:hypothetical protein
MKLFLSISALLTLMESADAKYKPVRISYDSLFLDESREEFLSAMQEVGIVSITNVPSLRKKAVLNSLSACFEENRDVGSEFIFDDASIRTTLATHSKASIAEPLLLPSTPECKKLEVESLQFRKTVNEVIVAFTAYLSTSLGIHDEPLLFDHSEKSFSFIDVVNKGEHLEHFHSYTQEKEPKEDGTLEWHIDQGVMLAFTPGMEKGNPTSDFYIEKQDGSTELVQFEETDDLVFFFGDGVNQFLNPYLEAIGMKGLRILPHALKLRRVKNRLWYGRMVLAPSSAIHPFQGTSYGVIRDTMINDSRQIGLGCTSSVASRVLADTNCTAGTSYCWHRCMSLTEYGVSEKMCNAKGSKIACVNDKGDLWPDTHDPSFKLGCAKVSTRKPSRKPTKPKKTKVPTKKLTLK